MPDPLGDGHEVDPAHHTVADEVVPAVVEANVIKLSVLSGQQEGFSDALRVLSFTPSLCGGEQPKLLGSSLAHSLQMGAKAGVEIHDSKLLVLGVSVSSNDDLLRVKVNVGPIQWHSFTNSGPREAQETHEVAEQLVVNALFLGALA